MNYSFKLRQPNSDKPTPIYLQVYFKEEKNRLIYPIDKTIHPKDWDAENARPKSRNISFHNKFQISSIRKRFNDVEAYVEEIFSLYEKLGEDLNVRKLKHELDVKLSRDKPTSNGFFDVYDEFLENKKNDFSKHGISESTYKRYRSYKNLLVSFEKDRKSKITFNCINKKFYNDLLKYSIATKKQSANTLYRNIGLFKTFMHWAFENQKTRNDEYKKFEKPSKQATTEIALDIDQVTELYNFDLSKNKRLEQVRDVFLIGCLTGQRFSNYTQFKNSDIVGEILMVPDCKDKTKILEIPCLDLTKEILEKYDYNLPIISNQKFNAYLKEVFEMIGYEENTKKIKRIGNEIIEESIPFYQRVSSHTARRSFITIMLNENVPIKIIMSITGHKSLENFILYYKPDDRQKVDKMKQAFGGLLKTDKISKTHKTK